MLTEKLIDQTIAAFAKCQTADGMRVPDGFRLEAQDKAGGYWEEVMDRNRMYFATFYRLVAIPQRVPLTVDDVPPGSYVREKNKSWRVVQMPYCDGVVLPSILMDEMLTRVPFQELFNDEWQILRPGEKWVPCWKVAQ